MTLLSRALFFIERWGFCFLRVVIRQICCIWFLNRSYINTVSTKMTKHSKNQLAKSAFDILNDLMGEIHGARITGIFAIKKPDIFMTKHPKYITRNSISIIVLSLRKFDDLWKNQLKDNLLLVECHDIVN